MVLLPLVLLVSIEPCKGGCLWFWLFEGIQVRGLGPDGMIVVFSNRRPRHRKGETSMWSVEEEKEGLCLLFLGFFSWRIFLSSFACMHIGKKYTSAMMITMQNLIFFQQVGDCVLRIIYSCNQLKGIKKIKIKNRLLKISYL